MALDLGTLAISILALVCLCLGTYCGMYGARWLKEQHLSKETQEAVKVGAGMVAAMASLVLGLMTASAQGTFQSVNHDLRSYAVDVALLDTDLRSFGPPGDAARGVLREFVGQMMAEIWPEDPDVVPRVDGAGSRVLMEALGRSLRDLPHADEEQTRLRSAALDRFSTLRQLRWTVTEESSGYVPTPFIVALIAWLTVVFASFGLFAPTNKVAVIALFLCSLSMAGALFIILEMASPFDGIVKVSEQPFTQVMSRLQAP